MLVLFAIGGACARAQSDAGGLFRPWALEDRDFEGTAEAILFDAGDTNRGNHDLRLSLYRTYARWRLDNSRQLNPTVGYSLTQLDLDTPSPLLPERLTDVSIGFGTPLHQFQNDWFIAASAAVGYAGNTAFNDANAWYARSTLILGRELGEDSTILIGLDYDGNRTIFPDIPLVGFAYTLRVAPTLVAAVGFPYSSVLWEPTEQVRVEAGYRVPDNYHITLSYEPTRQLRLFVNGQTAVMPFHIDTMNGRRRLFFEQQRIEAGARWQPYDLLGVIIAAGYAFNQDFSTGWDTRDLDHVTGISDEPYVRFAVEWRY